jgi:hypothetical protein
MKRAAFMKQDPRAQAPHFGQNHRAAFSLSASDACHSLSEARPMLRKQRRVTRLSFCGQLRLCGESPGPKRSAAATAEIPMCAYALFQLGLSSGALLIKARGTFVAHLASLVLRCRPPRNYKGL